MTAPAIAQHMTARELRYQDARLWWFDWCHLWENIALLYSYDFRGSA